MDCVTIEVCTYLGGYTQYKTPIACFLPSVPNESPTCYGLLIRQNHQNVTESWFVMKAEKISTRYVRKNEIHLPLPSP